MTIMTIMLTNSPQRLRLLLFAMVFFIGFLGVKGAMFGIATGGHYKVWGPPDSFLADNNDIGLAMVMIAPLCFALRETVRKKWQSLTLLGTGLSLIMSAVLTYSRGTLLGIATISLFYFIWGTAKQKIIIAIGGVFLVVTGFDFLPPEWFGRMNTIETYEEDTSANMRLNSWHMSFNLAEDNLLGGGFKCFSLEQYLRYAPNADLGKSHTANGGVVGSTAHSIYFQVLATQGFIGLAIYLFCLSSILVSLFRLYRLSHHLPNGDLLSSYARGLSVSIFGYMVNGAFLSRAFFDLFWAIFAAAICLKYFVYSGKWFEDAWTEETGEVKDISDIATTGRIGETSLQTS